LDDIDAHLVEHRVDVLDLVGGHLARWHHFVDLIDGDVAALLCGLDHLLDAGIREIEQRQRCIGGAFFLLGGFFFFFCLRRLCFARHSVSPGPSWPSHTLAHAPRRHGQKWPRRRAAAPSQVFSLLGTRQGPINPRMPMESTLYSTPALISRPPKKGGGTS